MWPFTKKVEVREVGLEDLLLSSDLSEFYITKDMALQIPTVSACTTLISNIVAGMQIKLYREVDNNIEEVKADNRVKLLNDETGDILDGFQFKKAMVEDYLLDGTAYAYINTIRNKVNSLHYLENRCVTLNKGMDPIFKDVKLRINGTEYENHKFITLTRKTKDGVTGTGIIAENNVALSVAYSTLLYEGNNIQTGGIKKGVIKSTKKLDKASLEALKQAWQNLYGKDSTENCIILNDGLDYKELQQTSLELQLNENKQLYTSEIANLFNTPISILNGTADEEVVKSWYEYTIIPILNAIECALNKNLLLNKEKGSFYFAFDIKNMLKGDILKRFQAYEIGVKSGILQIDEVRYQEDLEPLNLDFIKLGLADVLYNPKTREVYTPNTDSSVNLDKQNLKKGGEVEDEN